MVKRRSAYSLRCASGSPRCRAEMAEGSAGYSPFPAGGIPMVDPRRDKAEWNALLADAGARDARHPAAMMLLLWRSLSVR